MKLGINTFGLNDLLVNDFERTIHRLKAFGYNSMEPLIVFSEGRPIPKETMAEGLRRAKKDGGMWPEELARQRISWLRQQGFTVDGAQASMVDLVPGGLTTQISQIRDFAVHNDLHYIVYSPKIGELSSADAVADACMTAIQVLGEAGISFLYHAHHSEFIKQDGQSVFDYLMERVPPMKTEFDVGWAMYAGRDVLEMMGQYAGRIALLHLKDVGNKADCNAEPIFTAVGQGLLPLEQLMEKAAALGLREECCIVDQDASNGSMLTDLKVGAENIRR